MAYYIPWKMICIPRNTDSVNENFVAWKRNFNVSYIVVDNNSAFLNYPGIKRLATSGALVLLDIRDL